jgi:hypothetical protein
VSGIYNAGFGTLGMWDAPQDQPLVESFRFWVGRSRSTPAVVTDAKAWLRKAGLDVNAAALTVGSGLAIDGQVVHLTADLSNFDLGSYDLEVQATMDYGAQGQLRAVINVIQGLG